MKIELNEISKSYENAMVISNYSLTLTSGNIYCIMGESGKGKTTLLRMLMNLEKPDKGVIIGIENKRVRAVFQEERLLENNTVMDNILFVLPRVNSATKQRIKDACESVGLKDCETQYIRELSGGMKRRVAILRALLSEYDILLLDEPLKGLDRENKLKVITFMQEMWKDKLEQHIVIMVTHDIEETRAVKGIVIELD